MLCNKVKSSQSVNLSGQVNGLSFMSASSPKVQTGKRLYSQVLECDNGSPNNSNGITDKPAKRKRNEKLTRVNDPILIVKSKQTDKSDEIKKLIRSTVYPLDDPVKYIRQTARVCIGWDRCSVYEHLNLGRCYKCNLYANHSAEKCTAIAYVCGRCSKMEHKASDVRARLNNVLLVQLRTRS